MRGYAGSELGVELPLDLEHAVAHRSVQLGENDDAGFHSGKAIVALELRPPMNANEGVALRRSRHRRTQKDPVDGVPGVLMMPVHDFQSRECADRGAGDYVARPMLIVEHA